MECVGAFVKNEQFSRNRILSCALAIRITLVLYSHIHDYLFKVNFTDIDYHVFSDAAKHVSSGGSPFDRATYRYTPALAWILLPVVSIPDFGKIIFCVFDIVVAFLYFELLDDEAKDLPREKRADLESENTRNVVLFWLANPLTAIISARGNAEAIVSAIVLLNLYLLKKGYWKTAALVHGSLAIQFKIYPLIYLPSVFLSLSNWIQCGTFPSKMGSLLKNWKGFIYGIISIGSFGFVVAFFYCIYGDTFLEEYLLYHVKRRDIQHNFSPYFFVLYIFENDEWVSKLIGYTAFLPQLFLTAYFGFSHFDDLSFCWFITTFAFVTFNKVCTSQYFVWYIVLLPLVANRIKMPNTRICYLTIAWFGAQAQWLLFAYLFEFQGWNTFHLMFYASICFLIVNCVIIQQIRSFYMSYRKAKIE